MDELPPDPPDPRLCRIAQEMWALCCADESEEVIAHNVLEYHEELTEETYLAVWELLDSRQRSAWKAYRLLGVEIRRLDPHRRR